MSRVESAEDRWEDDSAHEVWEYIQIFGPIIVLLDTNVLIKACTGKSEERRLIRDACSLVDIRICDTVYWEFLRNTNIDSFREKRQFLGEWKNGDFLNERKIIREGQNIKEMHVRLFLLLLQVNTQKPSEVLRYMTPDLWIAAVAIAEHFDHVLTINARDFPSDFFGSVAEVSISRDCTLHLLQFDRKKVRKIWKDLEENPELTINFKKSL